MDTVSLSATMESVSVLNAFIDDACRRQGVHGDDILSVQLISEELATNICKYAYPDAAGRFETGVSCTPSGCTLMFTDTGEAFDPLSAATPDTSLSLEERDVGGLGIYFVRRKAEKLTYQRVDGRNIVTVSVRFR